ncbi:MAG: cation transporter [Candidatus Omnitrophica bacterium]|nr:cation transporter [Candidatus Omnitrophota bacterium]
MRRLISALVLISMTLFALSVNGAEGKVIQITLNVEGMTCPSCPAMVKMALKKLDGVVDADVNYKDAKAKVKYREGKVSGEQMIKAIEGIGMKAYLKEGE